MVTKLDLPSDYQWVNIDNYQFNVALDEILNFDDNIFIQAKAGCGKSLIIKMVSAIKENVVVCSTTGTTSMQLSSDGVSARTIHSFFQFSPNPIIDEKEIFKLVGPAREVMKKMETLIIDEVSMLNAQMFDAIVKKLLFIRKGTLPRIILFGDVLQLPPVVPESGIVRDFFTNTYGGNIMFFNSASYKNLGFKMLTLNQSYRQSDPEFANNIYSIGINSYDKTILDYFNQRVMPLAKYEKTHQKYVYMSSTNATVNRINKEYIDGLDSDKWYTFIAKKSANFPKNLIDDAITIKQGAQVMITRNNYEAGYSNGMIGTAIDLDENGVTIELEDGKIVTVGKSKYEINKPYLDDNGKIKYKLDSWAEQIDCKICRAMTIHKSQGKTFDSGYLALTGWMPPGIVYVGLSRLTSIEGLGISRPLTMQDISIFKEAMDFLIEQGK